jgi:hypothetical protein
MSTKPERPSTSDPIASATYQTARGYCVGAKISQPAMTQRGRTVVTSAKEGSLELRYAPRSPKVTDVSTKS